MSVEERANRASQQLSENSSLTDDLMDEEAVVVMDWAKSLAERFIHQTHYLDDTQAELLIEDGLRALRRTMRRLGRLVSRLEHLEPEAAYEHVSMLLEAAHELPNVQVNIPEDMDLALDTLRTLPTGEMLQQVLDWISLPEEDKEANDT